MIFTSPGILVDCVVQGLSPEEHHKMMVICGQRLRENLRGKSKMKAKEIYSQGA